MSWPLPGEAAAEAPLLSSLTWIHPGEKMLVFPIFLFHLYALRPCLTEDASLCDSRQRCMLRIYDCDAAALMTWPLSLLSNCKLNRFLCQQRRRRRINLWRWTETKISLRLFACGARCSTQQAWVLPALIITESNTHFSLFIITLLADPSSCLSTSLCISNRLH